MVFVPESTRNRVAGLTLAANGRQNAEELRMIERVRHDIREPAPGESLQQRGDRVTDCYFGCDGGLARRRESDDGGRFATSVFLPGDVFAMHLGFHRKAHFDIVAMTSAQVSIVDFTELREVVDLSDNIRAVLDWNSARTFNILSEHLVNNTALSAPAPVLHLLLELWCRLLAVGKASDRRFLLPLNQMTLGQLLGRTIVAVSKTLSRLRQKGLISYSKRHLDLLSLEDCMDFCDFSPEFLELAEPRRSQLV